MKVSVIAPVLNEAPWIGYSVMSALPFVHEFVYALDSATSDGTRALLDYVQHRYAYEKLKVLDYPTFHPSDTKAYNGAFNLCIDKSTGDACYFLHPDMIVTEWPKVPFAKESLAYWTHVTSFAGDLTTKIVKGRANRWKNLHRKMWGLYYGGAYGSPNEDFYHSVLTGKSQRFYGMEFDEYPFEVADSGIYVNHYCEVKSYERRLAKMKHCLKTQYPHYADAVIDDLAGRHQRVTLLADGSDLVKYEYEKTTDPLPEVILKHKEEFEKVIS